MCRFRIGGRHVLAIRKDMASLPLLLSQKGNQRRWETCGLNGENCCIISADVQR